VCLCFAWCGNFNGLTYLRLQPAPVPAFYWTLKVTSVSFNCPNSTRSFATHVESFATVCPAICQASENMFNNLNALPKQQPLCKQTEAKRKAVAVGAPQGVARKRQGANTCRRLQKAEDSRQTKQTPGWDGNILGETGREKETSDTKEDILEQWDAIFNLVNPFPWWKKKKFYYISILILWIEYLTNQNIIPYHSWHSIICNSNSLIIPLFLMEKYKYKKELHCLSVLILSRISFTLTTQNIFPYPLTL